MVDDQCQSAKSSVLGRQMTDEVNQEQVDQEINLQKYGSDLRRYGSGTS